MSLFVSLALAIILHRSRSSSLHLFLASFTTYFPRSHSIHIFLALAHYIFSSLSISLYYSLTLSHYMFTGSGSRSILLSINPSMPALAPAQHWPLPRLPLQFFSISSSHYLAQPLFFSLRTCSISPTTNSNLL